MKDIKIEPFPNWEIKDETFESVKTDSSKSGKSLQINRNKLYMQICKFPNEQKKVNILVPELKNGKTFMSVFPNPIQLYYSFAIKAFSQSEYIRENEFIKVAVQHNNQQTYILATPPDETHPLYTSYLQLKVGAIIMLTCSIEAFVNSKITDSTVYVNKKGEELNQETILGSISLKEKIKNIIPDILNIDFKSTNRTDYNQICSMIKIRNEFIHLKRYNQSPLSYEYQEKFLNLKKFKIGNCLEAVKKYMNMYHPNFIEEV